MTGIWVIAHECGHNAFSESQVSDVCIAGLSRVKLDAIHFEPHPFPFAVWSCL